MLIHVMILPVQCCHKEQGGVMCMFPNRTWPCRTTKVEHLIRAGSTLLHVKIQVKYSRGPVAKHEPNCRLDRSFA